MTRDAGLVTVAVLDRNDSPPSFRGSPLSFLVSEELAVGQAVATLAATDADSIGELSYALSTASSPFTLDARTGVIRLRDALDREAQDAYRLLVRASDGVQTTDAYVTIQVTDSNDNPPVFSQWAYSMEVREDAHRGSRVGQVSAKDLDEGPNGLVSYSVVSDWANDVFALHPQTGVFTLAARLDYEEVQHYIFVVQAADAGRPSLSSTLTVFINVLDVNDNAPLFDPMSYSDEVWENVTAGSSVVTVSATDLDSGANGRIEYAITAGDGADEFSMSPNGTILTRRALDREAKSSYNLVVTATDSAQPPSPRLSSTVQVSITVRDVNDNAPEFITPSETSVGENVAPGTVLLAVKAVDKDEGRNGYVEYSLDDDDVMFSLGAADGLLRVAGRLDRESRPAYRITVTARDRGDPPRATTADVLVRVLDENDNSPVFDPKQYSATVAENASIGTSVLLVSATDLDDGDNGRVRYSIWSGDDNRDFSISEDGGAVRVAKNLNFERKARYVLTVRAEDCAGDAGRFDTAVIAVNVADINDNPPTFLDSPYLAYVVEGVVPPPNGFVLRVRAFDADSPPFNGQVRYFLKEGDPDLFRIDANTGDITLQRALDREAQAEHILTLVAMDTGTPPLTGSGTVRVVVQDVNDHSPEFEREGRQGYVASARENAPAGTVILVAKASDKDEGLNAKIRYSLLGEHADRFAVDPETGAVSLAAPPDREERASYHLTLVAKDSSATDPRASAVNLTVTVLDENDNDPVFSEAQYTVHVPAGTGKGEFVFGAKAADADEGDNGRVRYSLSGDDSNQFRCDAATGVVTAAVTLSTDPHRAYHLTVFARDAGMPPRSASADLLVRVAPAAQFPAIRGPRVARFTLQEDDYASAKDAKDARVVTRVSAVSPKRGAAAVVKYAIAGGNVGDALRVDANTGDVLVSHGLDFETAPYCEVWVEARDSDDPPLRSLVQLLVNVTDANDNPPVMQRALYNATVMEEEFAPVRVVRVKATDRDSGVNGQLSYRLAHGQDGDGAFTVDPRTGEIYTKTKLDRESTATYQLQVEAVDEGRPQLTGSAAVLVTVLDKNDNPPRFSRLFSVNVTENSEMGTFVIRVTSSDLDEGVNANATYSFTENPGDKFAIDPISGNVTVAGPLDREQHDEYVLKVTAEDGAWRQETPLTVTIQDVNDNAPEFEHSYYSFNFPELQPQAVALVGQVSAADRDKQGPNSVISYSLKHPSDLFSVDPASGEVLSKRRLRYKHAALGWSPENQYPLTVLATDNGKPPMSSECLVTVNIVDANNNAPAFAQRTYFTAVPESTPVGRSLAKLVAKDVADFGVNAEIEYIKMGGNGSELISLDKTTGKVSLSRPLQGLGRKTYSVAVRAVDKGVPPQSDDAVIVLVVTGENKHSPVFKAPSSQVFVPENEPVGATILTVQADDADPGPNGDVRYSISGGNAQGLFAVNPRTGVVTILKALDYDTVPEHHLNITATDLGLDGRSATASLTVMLTDINDNPPTFNQSAYEASIQENSPPGTVVFTAHATDKDSPKNAVIHYSIVGGSGKDAFDVDPRTGVVTARVSFDYEERTQYTLDLLASNPDSAQYGSARLLVHITGVNEFYPRFVQPVFHLDVSEAAQVGTSVGMIQATDQDQGLGSKVYYLLVGSSNDRGFSVAPETGVVTVFRGLDRETQNRVVLTVMAKNEGSIRGNDTDEAQVIISIQDGNDPPEFLQPVYEAQVSEAAAPGTHIATVRAVDRDVRAVNNQFSYSILGGSGAHSFKVDPQTGEVETTLPLDREAMSAYTITVGAIDSGSPPETGTTVVRVLVEDVNDNAPRFETDAVGLVAENEPPGTSIMMLSATDADLPPNGAPFKYRLVGGRHRGLVTLDSATGLLRTAETIDREVTDRLDLVVEVEDSGNPPQRAQHPVTVTVLDQNDSPSTPRAMHLLVFAPPATPPSSDADDTPLGVVADVRPDDPDATGDYRCKLVSGPTRNVPLSIARACQLHAARSARPGAYSLSVVGNDGVHADVTNAVTVEIQALDNDTIDGTVTVRVDNITAPAFLAGHYKAFVDAVRAALPQDDHLAVLAYSVQERDQGVEVAVAARGARGYHSKAAVQQALQRRQDALTKLLRGRALTLGYSPCQRAACHAGSVCADSLRIASPALPLRVTDSASLVLSAPALQRDVQCRCADGFTGARCDRRQDPCAPNPCRAGGACRRQGAADYTCVCPAHAEGRHCERERGDACGDNPCRNGGSCRPSPDGGSFFCLCRPGFRGNECEAVADSCRPNPCLHGGACVALKPGYRCTCPDGRYGRHCERSAFGFRELSYAAFPSLDASTNDISVVFATTKPDALLVYNFGAQTGGRSDFVALELVSGRAVFSFGGARTAISSLSVAEPSASLADGAWHKVTATRNGRVVSLSVAPCTDNGETCSECRPDDDSCYAADLGNTGTLNFNGHPMLLGGLQAADPVLERPGQVSNDDFVGCVHSVAVNGRQLNMSSPLHSRGVEATCGRPGSVCASGNTASARTALTRMQDSEELLDNTLMATSSPAARCGAEGACVDRWTSSACECSTGAGGAVLAPDCGDSLLPATLTDGAFLAFRVSDMHRRMQLLDGVYRGSTRWHARSASTTARAEAKTLSLSFRTVRKDGLILYAASNKDFTAIQLRGGVLVYMSRAGAAGSPVNMTVSDWEPLWDGRWHNLTLESRGRALRLLLDGRRAGDELDPNGVHDFLDPYLTALSVGGAVRDTFHTADVPQGFEGCVANLTVNAEVQPLNGSGSILEALAHGKVWQGCAGPVGVGAAAAPDPLSIGITLVIVFFVILLVVILVSFVVFRLRRHGKEKGAGPGGSPGTTLVTSGGLLPGGVGGDLGRLHGVEGVGGDLLRAHHPELIAKKYKERDLEQQRPQRPDIIEREVVGVGKSPPMPMPPPPHHPHDATSMDPSMDMPEHYDLENASSIAPSDIDIVYHYKGYREGNLGNVRKYKASPAPAPSAPPSSYHHKHVQQGLQQGSAHRHTPFLQHPSRDSPRSMVLPPPTARVDSPPSVANSMAGGGTRVQHQSTPLARLSPSSEVSSQPRILTLQDISGKPLQSALLATTSSSGTVGVKDVSLHSNSERSLNSPVMSQLSGHSSSGSRKLCKPHAAPLQHSLQHSLQHARQHDLSSPVHTQRLAAGLAAGLTADEIQRFGHNPPRNSSLVSTLDAVSSTPHRRAHRTHLHHQDDMDMDDNHSTHSTTTDESGNDSFTCSEIEYDNNSVGGDGRRACEEDDDEDEATDTGRGSSPLAGKPSLTSIPPSVPSLPSYDGFDSSFRGSLSTLVASDDDLSTHMGVHGLGAVPGQGLGQGGPLPPSVTAMGLGQGLGWDYLLNWGPNFQSLVGVFKDIAELPDSVNGRVVPVPASLRLPASPTKPSEEYV
ncbi:cadherin-related tumor suppressor [Thrips palmi]|uniref:Cadherin-related tumor suppressor n=1 Tax=Thrips palmi TaxID=161013 RepID=A0A6P8ZNB2_THRPL|nr:cadherin-related tumor suppressor [Thrips palmi]